ncbi:MAG: hypothetical protein Q9207_006984 [Kuettlingeria erythrocarpa]
MALEGAGPTKRLSSAAGFDDPVAMKRKRGASNHHKFTRITNGACSSNKNASKDEVVEILLTRSISLALDAVGFEASEPLALESFRVGVQEYIHRFAADVRQSMLSCRRTEAIAPDFLQALHTHQLSLRALIPHLHHPVPKRRARVVLPHQAPEEVEQCDHHLLGATLNDAPPELKQCKLPHKLPPLPSKHTYQATLDIPEREEDPRKIRERATEEGRLGEEALRRLMSARATDRPSSARAGQGAKSLRAKRDELWKDTMQAVSTQYLLEQSRNADSMDLDLSTHETGSGYGRITSAVNADRKFWRKPAQARRYNQTNSSGLA